MTNDLNARRIKAIYEFLAVLTIRRSAGYPVAFDVAHPRSSRNATMPALPHIGVQRLDTGRCRARSVEASSWRVDPGQSAVGRHGGGGGGGGVRVAYAE